MLYSKIFARKVFFFLVILVVASGNVIQAESLQEKALDEDINAKAWIVMNADTGKILLKKNEHERHYPASITKVATTIMAIEQGGLSSEVTVSQTAADTIGSSLELQKGDKLPLKDLLYGIMLHSGNDGAVAVAEHIAGTEEEFTKKMTSFVKSLGARNTNFVNAHGLPDDQHYTSAYDMAVITRYAMQNPTFREIAGTKAYPWKEQLWGKELEKHEKYDATLLGIPWTGNPQVVNHNRILSLYEESIGGKNGFTHEARYTMVGAAQRGETEIIGVILRSDNKETAYRDMSQLLDHGFSAATLKSNQQRANNEMEDKGNQVVETFKGEKEPSNDEKSGTSNKPENKSVNDDLSKDETQAKASEQRTIDDQLAAQTASIDNQNTSTTNGMPWVYFVGGVMIAGGIFIFIRKKRIL